MNHILLHIPHASDHIPSYEGFVLSRERIRQEVELLTDWYTDELFPTEHYHSVIAGVSRLFCDVERFTEDDKEVMAKYGMGVLYEKTDDGTLMRKVNKGLRQKILNNYYWKHHHQLNMLCKKILNENDKLLIIDCHSFTDTPLKRDLSQKTPRPDFNIGTDDFHTPTTLSGKIKSFLDNNGYSVGINWPYAGTIVPSAYYRKDKRVNSVMIEVNRELYLDMGLEKKKSFSNIQGLLREVMTKI